MVYDYVMKCGYCGEENKEDSLYCMACGSRIGDGNPQADISAQGETVAFVLPDRPEATSFWDPDAGPPPDLAPKTSGFVFGPPEEPAAPPGPAASPPPGLSPAGGLQAADGPKPVEIVESTPAEAGYFMPPEADYPPDKLSPGASSPVPGRIEGQAAPPPSVDSTQAISPVPHDLRETSGRRVICPECYAANTEQNRYCQECGNPLSIRSSRPPAAAAPPAQAPQRTAVMPAELLQQELAGAARGEGVAKAARERSITSFGAADLLALLAAIAAAVALSPIFTWKKGLSIGIFSHQGAFAPGRPDLLGGPGILPYSGSEFFTLGLVVAIGLGLAAVFLALRFGRGPMFILSGSILLFPMAYMIWQGVLPLKASGLTIQPSVGLNGILFGGAGNPGTGPALWLITGAGVLLLLAGFLAPPRGWGRLFTFMLFLSISVGAAFFCAAAYNWNLFISGSLITGAVPAKALPVLTGLAPGIL
jgi:hypothetical protein